MNGPLGLRSRETLANRFHLGESLGRTRWGEVYLADDTETGEGCRVEVILRSGTLGGEIDRRLAREVRIGRELAGQPGFVTAYAWGRLGGERLFIARQGGQPAPFPLLASGVLRDRVEGVLEIARRIEVLACLGIAHRDLGPAALVDAGGFCLSGFGLAYLDGVKEPPEDPSGCPLSFLGSAAPEVIRALDFGGIQADAYSLGALLHAALTHGEWPQPESMAGIARWLVGYELPEPLADAPPELDSLRRAALDLDPDARPTASEIAQGLEAWLGVADADRPQPFEAMAGIDLSGRVRPLRTPEPLPGPGPGDVIGARFRLAVRLEQSRWGEVFQATDQVHDRPCRVELVLLSGERAEAFDRLADREVRVCLGIDSPGLLPAIAWGRLGPERLFVAREVIAGLKLIDLSGGSLRQRVRRVALAARRLGALGKQGIVHSDVGPHTLLQDGEGGIHVSGFARALRKGVEDPPLSEYSFLPTVAPEALVDGAAAGPRSDVYSLGALLFYVLTGRYPFPGPTLFDLLEQHEAVRAGEATVPKAKDVSPDAPPHLSVVCRRALSLEPKSRPARPNAFALALEEWLAVEEGDDSEADLEALSRSKDEDTAAAAEEAPPPRAPAIPQAPGTSTSIVLREFPESLLVPDSLTDKFEQYLHVCARCEQSSYLLPPMTAETSRCTHCKRGRLRPFGEEAKTLSESWAAESASDSAVDILTSSDPGATQMHTVVLELPESIRAPAGLERSLTEFKFTCMDCLQASYLLPPMTPANSRCTHCAGHLRPWKTGDDSLEPEEDLLADSSSAEVEAMPTITRRATGESRRVRRVPEASKLVSMARFRVECWRCGDANFVLPPQTPETSDCSACGATLRERRDSERIVAAVAQVASPSDSQWSLTADGISLEESDHGTGYIQWTSTRRVPTVKLPKRPAGKRITKKTRRPDDLLEKAVQVMEAPRKAITVKRSLDTGWLVLLALSALVAGGWTWWPSSPPVIAAEPERVDSRAVAAKSLDARYRLWLGNKTIDDSPRSAWCVLDLTHLGRGSVGVDVWRPGSEMSCTRSVVRSSGTIELTLRRTYDPGEKEKAPAWYEGDDEAEDANVVEVWELRGRLVGEGSTLRLEGRGKKKSLQWGRARSQTVRFRAERIELSEDAILEELDAAAKKPKPAPPPEPHG